MESKKFYITTPIYYANGLPHIGSFATTLVADALALYYRKKLGRANVFFTSGLDEHGTTVEQSSIKASFDSPKAYVDNMAKGWKEIYKDSGITEDYFVRTTNPKHEEYAQDFIKKLVDVGDVYKDTYKGKYCYGCEKFLTKTDLDERGLCSDHRPDQVIDVEEDNYFFKLSKYAPQVKKLIEGGDIKIIPENKKQELLYRIDQGVDDISVSRPKDKVGWGISFPGDADQTIYVWVEALINYLSSLEINNNQDFWNYSYHTLGKGINWFHNLIWPSMLLSAGKPLYKGTFVHSHLNIGGTKISKSLGNVIAPQETVAKYSKDGSRYVILSNLPYNDDSDVTWESLDAKYNADLANGIGNLVGRVTKMCETTGQDFIIDLEKVQEPKITKQIDDLMKKYELDKVCQLLVFEASTIDKELQEKKPWENLPENKEFLETCLNRIVFLLDSFDFIIPSTKQKVYKHLKIENEKYFGKVTHLTGLFPRV
jgi:methionyl-tRNA synthetase